MRKVSKVISKMETKPSVRGIATILLLIFGCFHTILSFQLLKISFNANSKIALDIFLWFPFLQEGFSPVPNKSKISNLKKKIPIPLKWCPIFVFSISLTSSPVYSSGCFSHWGSHYNLTQCPWPLLTWPSACTHLFLSPRIHTFLLCLFEIPWIYLKVTAQVLYLLWFYDLASMSHPCKSGYSLSKAVLWLPGKN